MELKDKLTNDLKEAMRAKDQLRVDTVRAVRGAVTNREVEKGSPLDEAEVLATIRSLVKQRAEAIEQYRVGGRDDLVATETREKEILETYLPAAPDAAAVEAAAKAVIAELGASSMKDMGKVMKETMARLGPAADGKQVSTVIKAALS